MKRFRDSFRNNDPLRELRFDKQRFCPTVKDIGEWFDILNERIFNNQLKPFDKKIIKNYRQYHALFTGKLVEDEHITQIEIGKAFADKRTFVEILAHEMVHLYQYHHNEPVDHGRTFRRWRDKFIENGINLQKEYN